jgi:glycosyltransferase involved in cell wall biosynthesis
MKIGFDGSVFVGPKSGIPNYALNLLRSLSILMPESTFLVFSPKPLDLDFPGNVGTVSPKFHFMQSHTAWMLSYPFTKACRDLDLFISPNGYLPPWLTVPVMNCVHDFTYVKFSETMTRRGYWTRKLLQKYWIKRARWIVANSKQTANEIQDECLRTVDFIVRPAVSDEFSQRSPDAIQKYRSERHLPKDFVLFVGTLEPRKNIRNLIAAFEQLTQDAKYHHLSLLLVGAEGWGCQAELIEGRIGKRLNIISLSDVEDWELPLLYSAARVFVLPSLYEGFGIPLLEARACGAAMIATDLPATREAGGTKPYYCEPTSQGLAEALEHALVEPERYRDQERPGWTWISEAERIPPLIRECSE